MQPFLSSSTGILYRNIVKPVLFTIDAETVHNGFVSAGRLMGQVPLAKQLLSEVYAYAHQELQQDIAGITFSNPIGLAAGFDYDANLTQVLHAMGFGFQTVGTITAKYYEGNEKPRLGRLPKSKSLLVNKGYKSAGVKEVVRKLRPLSFHIPVGMSVGSTNKVFEHEHDQIDDMIESFTFIQQQMTHHHYYELNISCPNLKTGEPFTSVKRLKALLDEVEKVQLKKPVFIKMPTDIPAELSSDLLKIADKYTIEGAIFGNLTKDRKNPDLVPDEVARATKGNFSGKPVERRANALLADAYRTYGKRFVLIGCGGVFSAEDAYLKIKLGASLVQMITGMIFQGPQVVGQINQGLVELLHKDGFEHISEAIGKGNGKR